MMFMDSKMMEMARELFMNSRDLTFEESQAIRSYYHKRYRKDFWVKTMVMREDKEVILNCWERRKLENHV